MMPITSVLVCCSLVLAGTAASAKKSATPVAPKGTTTVTHTGPGPRVSVKIRTHEVKIGKRSDLWPMGRESSCTYSRYPCSLVDQVEVTVDGKALFVPRSVFCDLADLISLEIKSSPNGMSLVILGGDASESYIVRVDFDGRRITKRTLSSGMEEDTPVEETIYHDTSPIGD